MNRRGFLQACLVAAAAPAIVRVGSLMPIVQSRLLVHPVIFPAGIAFTWEECFVAAAVAEKLEQTKRGLAAAYFEAATAYKKQGSIITLTKEIVYESQW